MAEANLKKLDGSSGGKVNLPEGAFGIEPNRQAVYEAVKGILANQRQGTSSVKTRHTVSGTTAKPFRQKGTGRARAGSNKSPLWVGGGRIHGPSPRDHSVTVPKKTKRLALRSVLSDKAAHDKIDVIDGTPKMDAPKTKVMSDLYNALAPGGEKCLLVLDRYDANLYLSVRNLPRLWVTTVRGLNTYDALNVDRIVLTNDALKALEERE